MDSRLLLLLFCFFVSGLAGLLYETAWTRQFSLVFGASAPAVATVLAAYMAGLASGAAVARHWVDRIRRPVLAYAVLELGVGLGALAVAPGLRLAALLQSLLLGGGELPAEAGSGASAAFYLVVSFVVLMVPTVLMGATLPLLTRHAVHEEGQVGRRVGLLYTVNTMGAAAGTLVAAFVLLPRLGLGRTIWVGVALNGLVFVAAAALARTSVPARPQTEERAPASMRHWMLPLVLLSGFVSFSLEVLWSRLLTHILGGSVYAFATMLATFLVGIAIGSAVGARLASTRSTAPIGFGVAQMGIALLSLGALVLVDRVPALAGRLAGEGAGLLLPGVLLSSFTLLPAALCVGATFPFAVRSVAVGAGDAARATAQVYAWNTIGAIFGAVATGFLLLPALRFAGTASTAAAVSLLVAAVTFLGHPVRGRRLLAGVAFSALLVLAFWRPTIPWAVLRFSALGEEPMDGEVLFYRVGRSSTVLLLDQGGWWRLTTNGLPESAIEAPGSRRLGITGWLAMLPLVVRPEARALLVIGLGAGQNVQDIPDSVASIGVVELEPEVVAANRFARDWRGRDPLADPRLQIYTNDARTALSLSQQRFDAIVSQPSHPWTAGAANLYTREFFELVRERLKPDGVFVPWMGLPFVDDALLRTLAATLLAVFPHVEVYHPSISGAVLFVAGTQPLEAAETVARSLATAPRQWRELGVMTPEDILMLRVLDTADVRRFAAEAPVNTDDHNLLQTRSPRILTLPAAERNARAELLSFYSVRRSDLDRDLFYMARRLVELNALGPASRVAHTLYNRSEREAALGLVELAQGRHRRAEQRLWAAEREDPSSLAPLFGLFTAYRAPLRQGGGPERLVQRLRREPSTLAVLEAAQQLGAGGWRAARELDPALAAIDTYHPFFAAALRQRLEWRLASGEEAVSAEALELADLLSARGGGNDALLLRARAGLLAGNDAVALASLWDLLPKLGPRRTDLLEQAKEIALQLPDELDRRGRAGVLARLEAKLQTGRAQAE